jgi:glyoxylase-like metal-dependent hydrolase (beta-lactamase superfamily II)
MKTPKTSGINRVNKLENQVIRFSWGDVECWAIKDGTIVVPTSLHPQLPDTNESQQGETMDVTCLLLKIDKHTLLIDTGCGAGIDTHAGWLTQNLQRIGVNCSKIDFVIHSHGHGDHVNGNTDSENKPAFPNARYIMHKKEWEFWIAMLSDSKQNNRVSASIQKNLLSIRDRFDLIEDVTEIIPGIRPILAPGHTPGSVVISASKSTKQIVCVGDVIHQPEEFSHPDLWVHLDYSPEQAIRTRNQMLSQADEYKSLVFACHFPFPGLGYVGVEADNFVWRPIEKLSLN